MINRIKLAWYAFRHGIIKSDYLYPTYNPNKFVQLLNHQDVILALDAEGKLWQMRRDYDGFFTVQFLLESPREY